MTLERSEEPAVTDGHSASARETLQLRYPGAAGSPVQVALDLIQVVARTVGVPVTGLAPHPAESAPPGNATEAAAPADPPVEHVLAALTLLRWLGAELCSWEPKLIAAARERGASWANVAPALGVASRQAAERRYL